MKLGIDFGTTNSAIAHFDGEKLHLVQADANNANPNILPSLIYFGQDGQFAVGTEAAERYLAHESNRQVRWQSKPMGQILMIVAGTGGSPIQYWQPLNILVDVAATGRLFQSAKTYLRNLLVDGTQIFDRYLTIDQILATLLLSLKHQAETHFKQSCEAVVIGRPVNFSHDPVVDRKAEEILYKAAYLAGFEQISFALEPIGALFLYHTQTSRRTRVLTFDFGGGTLDLTIAEVGGHTPPKILATRGVLIGGDDLDQKIMQMLFKHFAADERTNSVALTDEMSAQLQTWQTMPELSKPHYQEQINQLTEKARRLRRRDSVRQLEALNALVKNALGYSLFQTIEATKKQLSDYVLAPLKFEHEKLRIHETIKRSVLENRMRKEIAEIETAIDDVIQAAGLSREAVDYVVRTGGTSQTPMFIELLTELFGPEKMRDIDPLTSVVGGLAIMAHQAEGRIPAYAPRYMRDPRMLIRDLAVASDQVYEPFILQAGEQCYRDRDTIRFNHISINLSALPAIRTADADLNNTDADFLSFTVTAPARIYVAYNESPGGTPEWLSAFSPTPYLVEIKDDLDRITRMAVYAQDVEAGRVTLGGNSADEVQGVYHHYIVIVEKRIP